MLHFLGKRAKVVIGQKLINFGSERIMNTEEQARELMAKNRNHNHEKKMRELPPRRFNSRRKFDSGGFNRREP